MNRTVSPVEQGGGGLRDIAGGMNANRVQRTPLRQAQAQLSGTGLIHQPTRAFSSIPRRSTNGSNPSRAFQPNRTFSTSISGSETDSGERRSVFQSVAAGAFAKARDAPRVIAQPTPARTGPGGFRPARHGSSV
ncbi:unnamed protein product [Rhizoctonia solani]|uniref:Uncharacterized protein n=1 Tax=Rhizoctonia solani TaxID=456999 RepID=A0A8H3B885_9AGAM|nr:unnamed protein product [Rhizoctonia solani]CAE6524595.1 unnamed protein product [Rhizoctonia solani]